MRKNLSTYGRRMFITVGILNRWCLTVDLIREWHFWREPRRGSPTVIIAWQGTDLSTVPCRSCRQPRRGRPRCSWYHRLTITDLNNACRSCRQPRRGRPRCSWHHIPSRRRRPGRGRAGTWQDCSSSSAWRHGSSGSYLNRRREGEVNL